MAIPGKTFSQLTKTATRADLVQGNIAAIETPEGYKKLPLNLLNNGFKIFESLEDAILKNADLTVGDYFETNGFHSSGDGGKATYLVSDIGTPNGKSCILLNTGKFALLQYGDWVTPDELGYTSNDDVAEFIGFIVDTLRVEHIRLRARTYYWRTCLNLGSINDFRIKGDGWFGAPRKMTYISVRPASNIGQMAVIAGKSISIENLNIEVTSSDYIKEIDGFKTTSYADNSILYHSYSHIVMNSFKNCWNYDGGYKYHLRFDSCYPANSNIGIHFRDSSAMTVEIRNTYFNNLDQYGLWIEGNMFSCKCAVCNFGSINTGVKLSTASVNQLYQNVTFENSNFEMDTSNENLEAGFVDCYDVSHPDTRQNLTFIGCHFTLAKASQPVQSTVRRLIRLGSYSNVILIGCQLLGKDEPQYPDWQTYPKLLWNENYLPSHGSIIECGNNLFFDYPDVFLPFVLKNGQSTEILAYGSRGTSPSPVSDCNDWLPDFNGQTKIARVSTFENTVNMPTTGIWGFLYVMGLVEGVNKRVLQMLLASNGNIYTRVIKDTGNGWVYDPWKTIAAS